MDKKTTSRMLEILSRHGSGDHLSSDADDRVTVYLHVLDQLPDMVRRTQTDLLDDSLLTPEDWEHLGLLSRGLADAAELSYLLYSVQRSAGMWDE